MVFHDHLWVFCFYQKKCILANVSPCSTSILKFLPCRVYAIIDRSQNCYSLPYPVCLYVGWTLSHPTHPKHKLKPKIWHPQTGLIPHSTFETLHKKNNHLLSCGVKSWPYVNPILSFKCASGRLFTKALIHLMFFSDLEMHNIYIQRIK